MTSGPTSSRARASRSAPLRSAKSRVNQLEAEIAKLEAQQAELTAALEAPETYNEHGRAQNLNRELSATVDRLATATEQWEAASKDVQRLEAGQ